MIWTCWSTLALARRFSIWADGHQQSLRILAGAGEVRVHSARVNVYRKRQDAVTITVLDGVVAVRSAANVPAVLGWQRELGPNQQLIYKGAESIQDVTNVVAKDAASWTEGRIVFANEPLSNVVEELNRYSRLPIVNRVGKHARWGSGCEGRACSPRDFWIRWLSLRCSRIRSP